MTELILVPVSHLRPHPANARRSYGDLDELAASMRERGLIQPLRVCPNGEPGNYTIIAGHRRWLAAQRAGIDELLCVVSEMSETDQKLAMLTENLQRADLSPLEEARAYQAMIADSGMSVNKLATSIGKSHSQVSQRLKLLDLDEVVQGLVENGSLSLAHGEELGAAPVGQQRRFALRSVRGGWTFLHLKRMIRQTLDTNGAVAHMREAKAATLKTKAAAKAAMLAARPQTPSQVQALLAGREGAVEWARVHAAAKLACRSCGGLGLCADCPLPEMVTEMTR